MREEVGSDQWAVISCSDKLAVISWQRSVGSDQLQRSVAVTSG